MPRVRRWSMLVSCAALAPLWAAGASRSEPAQEDPGAGAAPGAAQEVPLAVRVNAAIARGVKNLQGHQQPDGRWLADETRYPGGLTAFGAYTLVKAGVRRSDPKLNAALRALAEIPHRSTYDTSARLLLYAALGEPDRWRAAAEPCLSSLVAFQREGLWGYPEDPLDLSNVQFALLGLRAAQDLGLEVPEETLASAAKALFRLQDARTGGFRYRDDMPATGGITAATLGDVALLEELARDRPAVAAALRKRKSDLAAAETFLTERWDPARNAWGPRTWTPSFHHAYLWAVERWCELKGMQRLGERDWYAEGALHLVDSQKEDGGWGEALHDTCFALLFLRKTTFSGGKELAELYAGAEEAARENAPEKIALDAAAPWLTDWLAAGPIQGKDGDSGLFDPPFDAARLRPREGAKVAGAAWRPVALKSGDWTNLEELSGRGGDACLWLLATSVAAPDAPAGAAEPLELLLWLALEDGWRIFLDGEEISRGERVQAPIRTDERVPLALAPGSHELIVVLEDALGAAAFGARLSDAQGRPPAPGVTAGLESSRKR